MCHVVELERHSELYELISRLWPPKKFPRKCAMLYAGQVPNVSFLILAGEAEIEDPDCLKSVGPNTLFAMRELILGDISRSTVFVKEDTLACFFDRQALLTKTEQNPKLKAEIENFAALNALW